MNSKLKIYKVMRLLMMLWFICISSLLPAQQNEIDSLGALLAKFRTVPNHEADTNYINTLNYLAYKYNQIRPDTTILISEHALALSTKINYLKGKADAYKNEALGYNVRGEYNRSLALFAEALLNAKKAGYTKGMGSIYYGTGIIYSNLGKYPEALENYFQALRLRDSINDKVGIASCTNAIGAIYFVQGKYEDALNNYIKALKLSQETNFVIGIESAYANIGEVYYRQGNYSAAQQYLFKALKSTEKTGNKENMAFISNLLGSIHYKQGDYVKAMESYRLTKKLADEIGSREFACRSYFGLGEVFLKQNNIIQAIEQTNEGIRIAGEIGYTELLKDGNEILSRIYEKNGQPVQALFHYKQYKLFADSINNQQTKKRANNLASDYEYSKKEILLKADQEKKQLEFQKKTNQQRWIIFSAFAALFSVLVVAMLIYRSGRKQKIANLLLHRKNIEIDNQKLNIEKTLVDLKAAQSQLIQSEKMASLGELTAGIAHEIQNPLNFVNNFSEINSELIAEMKEEMDKGNLEEAKLLATTIDENEQKIIFHGKRADGIVKGMLQHSRSSSGVKESTDINALADEYLRLAYHGLRAKDKSFNATIKTDFDESIGNINIIPQDIGRVILNLITNAFYVVDEKKKSGIENYEPTISVSTKKEGDKVLIAVTDNANGIPQNVLNKIFQPFFTTKPTGQGTGLGLSLSYDIVKKHNGELKVETKEGEGTTFIIQLPV